MPGDPHEPTVSPSVRPSVQQCGHVALAGRPNVGKSALLNALVGEHLAIVSPKAQATRLPVVGLRTEADVQFIFHDLPGLLDPDYLMQQRMRELALQGARRADVIVHLHPAPEAPAPDFTTLAGLSQPLPAPVLTVYTKADLVPDRLTDRPTDGPGAHWVSATTGEGIPELLREIAALLPIAPFEFPADDLGTQPLRFFAVEYLREAAFELLGDEVPYAFTAEVDEFREHTDPVYIRATLYVERNSQKGILIGEGGRTIKELGRRARMRLEQLMGQRVFLETWVKVLANWRKDGALLERFGFPGHRSSSDP
ncbi:MAG TPA: GTPase Era [Gemmatimonadales bacterium]|jgi:GTP-binding protein Era